MIFFAVSAGFMAENYRERLKEKEQVHKYIESMVSDLRFDIAMFDSTTKESNLGRRMIDNLFQLLKSKSKNTSEIYYLAKASLLNSDAYYPNTKTFDQMKSSGSLRLIRQENILDSITSYYQKTKIFEIEASALYEKGRHVWIFDEKLFDGIVFQTIVKTQRGEYYSSDYDRPKDNPPLLSDDPGVINSVIMSYHCAYGNLQNNEIIAAWAEAQARRLVELLEKEYELTY